MDRIKVQRFDVVAVGAILIFSDTERGDTFQGLGASVHRNDASLDAEAGHGFNGLGFAVRIESGGGGGVNGVQNLVARHCFFLHRYSYCVLCVYGLFAHMNTHKRNSYYV